MLPLKENCCSCLACQDICPRHAINIVDDECGFKYPIIIKSKCINCGLCEKTCPVLNKKEENKKKYNKIFACYDSNIDELKTTASGGIATLLMKHYLKRKWWVAGVIYTNRFKNAEYILTNDLDDLEKLKSSKYFQTDKKSIYIKVKSKLNKDNKVLFIGLPCEVMGLKSFLGKNYENLITVSLICMGPTSQYVNQQYIELVERKYNSQIVEYNVRSKERGWGAPNYISLKFENGNRILEPFNKTEFGNAFQILGKESCMHCNFKLDNNDSDAVIGDFWGVSKESPIYNNYGVSIIIVKNERILKLLDELNELKVKEVNFSDSIVKNNMILSSRSRDKRYKRYKRIFVRKGLLYADRNKDTRIKKILKKIIKK